MGHHLSAWITCSNLNSEDSFEVRIHRVCTEYPVPKHVFPSRIHDPIYPQTHPQKPTTPLLFKRCADYTSRTENLSSTPFLALPPQTLPGDILLLSRFDPLG
jgi:hypothetical protein